jgi:hypothetical protein
MLGRFDLGLAVGDTPWRREHEKGRNLKGHGSCCSRHTSQLGCYTGGILSEKLRSN